jgi:hypothetical protein
MLFIPALSPRRRALGAGQAKLEGAWRSRGVLDEMEK